MNQYTLKPYYLKLSLFLVTIFCFSTLLTAQLHVQLTVNSGTVTTTCTDNFGSPDPQWRVNVAGNPWTTYPAAGFCYQNPPYLQHDQTYTCPSELPNWIEVCFRAFEDDGSFCTPSQSCSETICQFFPVPDIGSNSNHTLSLPTGLSSWGEVNFTLEVNGTYNGPPNDYICNAIDFGVLPFDGIVGDGSLSNYNNICASNEYEPNPSAVSYFNNEQGVWFTFTTSESPNYILINAYNDPQNLGDDINMQMVLYESDDGTCSGNLTAVFYSGSTADYDEWRKVECMKPDTKYFLMIDGSALLPSTIEGYFGLEIRDAGAGTSPDLPCDALDFGQIQDNGSVTFLRSI